MEKTTKKKSPAKKKTTTKSVNKVKKPVKKKAVKKTESKPKKTVTSQRVYDFNNSDVNEIRKRTHISVYDHFDHVKESTYIEGNSTTSFRKLKLQLKQKLFYYRYNRRLNKLDKKIESCLSNAYVYQPVKKSKPVKQKEVKQKKLEEVKTIKPLETIQEKPKPIEKKQEMEIPVVVSKPIEPKKEIQKEIPLPKEEVKVEVEKEISIPKPKREIRINLDGLFTFLKGLLKKLAVSLVVLVVVTGVILLGNRIIKNIKLSKPEETEVSEEPEQVEEVKKEVNKNFMDLNYQQIWLKSYKEAFNKDDFVCQILFESGIIDQPVVQGIDNDYYLRRDFRTDGYTMEGPVFIDSNCDVVCDSNIVLYGHNAPLSQDPNREILFSSLHLLEDKNNYKENKDIYLIYRNRVDKYVVTNVYDVNIIEDDAGNQFLEEGEPVYYINNYSEEDFETYINEVENKTFYKTGESISYDDELLTLQTCYEENINKLIVLAKKVDTMYFEEVNESED